MVFEDICNTGLSLGSTSTNKPQNHLKYSLHHHHQQQQQQQQPKKLLSLKFDHVFPSLTLGLSSSFEEEKVDGHDQSNIVLYQQASSVSVVSSYSNSSVKRERDISVEDEEVEVEKVSSKVGDDQDDKDGSARKKLRLTKEQSVILEDNFKEHSTLNPKQKLALAKQLNLQPRQVEVWFQNRRARTKLKQTEVECELLKKCCETLAEENRRLQKEVQELKATKVTAPPFYMQIPAAATLTVCPSCEKISGGGTEKYSSKSPFSIGAKPHFLNPFTHPSAAC